LLRGTGVQKLRTVLDPMKMKRNGSMVLQAENGTFTPPVFAVNGAMAKECAMFTNEMIAEKLLHSIVANNIRTVISFYRLNLLSGA